MNMQKYPSFVKLVIFDLDGTITEPFLDFDVIREQMQLSPDSGPILEILAKSPEDERKKMKNILAHHERQAIENSSLNPGVTRTLDKLKEMGIKTAILTRNTRENAVSVIEKHNLDFDTVMGRDCGPVKPDASGVLKLTEEFGVSPQQVLVVGDYLHDLQAAAAAGAHPVLIKTHKNYTEFLDYAEFEINSIDEVVTVIEKLNDTQESTGGKNYAV